MVTAEYFEELKESMANLDVSAIYDGKAISFARKVVLNDDKTKVLFA